MTGDHIQDIFNDYLKAENTQYAIMINGSWGSGKTHFWKEKLHPLVLRKNLKPIYISLNGISKIEGLEYQMLLGLTPYISNSENKVIKSSTKFIGNAANAVTKFFTRSSSFSDIFKGVVIDNLNYSGKIICFDDLERCQIPIEEVLGFINNFIEHKSLKAIFLADEKKLENEKYHKAKEKIIRHTLNFAPSLTELVPLLALKFKTNDPEFYNFLTNRLQLFTAILEEYKENNLRNISFIMDCLQKLFPVFRNEKEDIHTEIIFFSIIISIEYKSGNLKSTDYIDHKKLDRLDKSYERSIIGKAVFDQIKKKEEIEQQAETPYEEKFYFRYLTSRLDNYFFFPSVYRLILSGYIDIDRFKNEIETRKKIILSDEQKDLQKILDGNYYKRLDQQEFDHLTSTVLNNALQGKYYIYDYPYLLGHYIHFAQNGLINETTEDITNGLRKGIDIAIRRKELDAGQLQNLMTHESPEHIEEFKNIVQHYHYQTEERNYLGLSEQLIKGLIQNNSQLLKTVGDELVKTIYPFFNSIDKNNLFQALLQANNAILDDFKLILRNRYHHTDIHLSLKSELESFEFFRTKLIDYLSQEKSIEPLRHHLLKILLDEITMVLNALENKFIGSSR